MPIAVELRPGFPGVAGKAGCAWVACRAAFCRDLQPHALQLSRTFAHGNNRSKFNVPLGVEAQGFCILG
jgi:hypothetical protein